MIDFRQALRIVRGINLLYNDNKEELYGNHLLYEK